MKLRLRTTFPGASHRLRARTPGLRALDISSVQNSVTGTPCPRVASGENGYHGNQKQTKLFNQLTMNEII